MNGACPPPMGGGPAVTPQTAIVSSSETNQRPDPCKPTASASMKDWHQNSLLEGTTPLLSYFLRWEAGEKAEGLVHSALTDLPGQRKDTSQNLAGSKASPSLALLSPLTWTGFRVWRPGLPSIMCYTVNHSTFQC